MKLSYLLGGFLLKRTGEITLSIIAGALNLLVMLGGFRILNVDSRTLRVQLMASGTNQNITSQDINQVIQVFHLFGVLLVVLSVISIILAVVALIFLFRRSLPILSGCLLIVAGVLSLPAFFPGVLYLIAGIMNLVRKPPVQID